MKNETSFVKAGAILVVSGFVVKVLSAAYRIPLTRMLGASLMGKYSTVFNLLMPFFAFATAGITPSVSRFTAQLIAKDGDAKTTSLKLKALRLYMPISLAMAVLFVAFGRFYSDLQQDEIFFFGALILAPSIVFASVETVCKGITQGRMNMLVTAKANVMESVTKTAFGLGAVYFIKKYMDGYPPDFPVAACLASVTLSGAICAVYLFSASREKGQKGLIKAGNTTRRQLLSMSVPISASALVASGVAFFDTAVCLPVIGSLPYKAVVQSFAGASFMGAGEVEMYLYGIWQGMVMTIFNLTPAILASIGAACMPVMTASQSTKDKTRLQRQAKKLFCITGALSVPSAVFIFTFRGDIVQFLFGTTDGQTHIASQLLAVLMPCCVPACFVSAFNAVLNAHGKSGTVFKILGVASVARCVLSRVLCGIPSVNIKAFAVSGCAFYAIIFVMSIIAVLKTGIKFPFFSALLLPLLTAAGVMAALDIFTGMALYSLPVTIRLFFSGIIFSLCYLLVLLLSGFAVDIGGEK